MKYLLDTDSVSYALRGHGDVGDHLRRVRPSEVRISSITYAELVFGVERKSSKKLRNSIKLFTSQIEVVPFGSEAAIEFGRIGSLLADRGTPIGQLDVLIAAHAVSLRCVLVTNNVKHFSRVPHLKIENWT